MINDLEGSYHSHRLPFFGFWICLEIFRYKFLSSCSKLVKKEKKYIAKQQHTITVIDFCQKKQVNKMNV